MESIKTALKKIGQPRIVFPDDTQCKTCVFFFTEHPEVRRRVAEMESNPVRRSQRLKEASCRCREREAAEKARAQRRISWANLPHEREGFQRTFDNFKPAKGAEAGLAAAREFAEGKGCRILVLVGETGTGKSHLLEAIGRAAIAAERSVRYEQVRPYVEAYREASSLGAERNVWDLDEWYSTFPALLLDDMRGESVTEFHAERLLAAVESRLMYGGRLALATNLAEDEVAARYGARLASRLWDRSDRAAVRVVVMTGKDYRRVRS